VVKPRVLLLDVETQPDLVWTWRVYEANAIDVKEHWQLLSFSAKWLDTRVHITKGLPNYPGYKPGGDDLALVKELHGLLDAADIVVAHNGVDFDLKKITARMMAHGLTPPSPYRIVDTKRTVKQVSAFSSNKLDWLGAQLELGRKLEHQGWAMWRGCMVGDPAAWKRMLRYNRHDVVLLERLYKLVAPWIKQPNGALYSGDERCVNPQCGSKDLQVFPRLYYANTRAYRRFQCRKCGKWARASVSERTPRAPVV
jgi:hypothetical protein